MEKKYFGTDGIRGRVGEGVITAEFMLRLGRAIGVVMTSGHGEHIVIGKDTRISGYMFESALEAGLSAAGVDIKLLGPMPTPGVAYLTRTLGAAAGIVISASHNPHFDNGIKFFSPEGGKLADDIEFAIEAELEKPFVTVSSEKLGRATRVQDAAGRYIEFCKSTMPAAIDFKSLNIVVDCAHGATYHIAPNVLLERGAKVTAIGVSPNGLNINDNVGSTKPELLRQAVLESKADIGIALDGDGDRLIMVDHKGEVVDGDELLFVIAKSRVQEQTMRGAVVGTLMSNLGLEHALKRLGLVFERADVGDRYVMEALKRNGWFLGGESSGHVICLDRTTTGDGIVAVLQVLVAMVKSGKSLFELKSDMTKYPQKMINVSLSSELDLTSEDLKKAVREVELDLGSSGRVLLRPSGTEPVVRVMVEGEDGEQVETLCQQLADKVKSLVA
ncbi:MAG: phosphoglucosamine mutase [Methylococcales bacterium]|nr:phosphoglucosamine mutase [Methylococcales bacterium]MBT7443996.1 phosphoglucosamine mutase [Methylococcales bacterium]